MCRPASRIRLCVYPHGEGKKKEGGTKASALKVTSTRVGRDCWKGANAALKNTHKGAGSLPPPSSVRIRTSVRPSVRPQHTHSPEPARSSDVTSRRSAHFCVLLISHTKSNRLYIYSVYGYGRFLFCFSFK